MWEVETTPLPCDVSTAQQELERAPWSQLVTLHDLPAPGCPFSHCPPAILQPRGGLSWECVNVPKLQLPFGLFILIGLIMPRKSL